MSTTLLKHHLFSELARVAKALSHGNRLELLEFIAQDPRSVEALAAIAGLSVPNTSQHLQQLRHAGLVRARREAQHVYYDLAGDDVVDLLTALRAVAGRHVAEVNRLVETYLRVRDRLEPVPREELLDRARRGLVTVLDVRPPDEYAAGHLPGARNVPLEALEAHLARLDPDQEVVAYCRGPHCVLAYEAVARLRARGLRARRLQDGFPEWRAAGLPVE